MAIYKRPVPTLVTGARPTSPRKACKVSTCMSPRTDSSTARARTFPWMSKGSAVLQQMQDKLKTEAGKAVYKMRKQILEPVFGYIKEGRGFRRFSFRGLGNVRSEWRLICATHNLLKLFRSGWKIQPWSA